MNDTPKQTLQDPADTVATEPIEPVSDDIATAPAVASPVHAPAGRGQQPVTRNQAAIAAAIVVVGIGGFAIGKASSDERPVAFHGGQALRGEGGPGGGQQGGPGGFGGQQGGPGGFGGPGGGQQGGPGGGRQGESPGGRGGPWDQRDDQDRGGEQDSQDNDNGE